MRNQRQLLVEKAAVAAGMPYALPSSASRDQKIADAHKWSKKYGGNILGQLKVTAIRKANVECLALTDAVNAFSYYFIVALTAALQGDGCECRLVSRQVHSRCQCVHRCDTALRQAAQVQRTRVSPPPPTNILQGRRRISRRAAGDSPARFVCLCARASMRF
jgi:hypothetical protein